MSLRAELEKFVHPRRTRQRYIEPDATGIRLEEKQPI
jgi:hypothetical protein